MLGVRRSGVTVAASTLSRAGMIRYQRGQISILNREHLEATSCECYRVIQKEYARLLGNQPSRDRRMNQSIKLLCPKPDRHLQLVPLRFSKVCIKWYLQIRAF